GKLDKPVKDLAAFTKTKELKPGESEAVTIDFDLADLASYDEENASYILEKGIYTVLVGNSSANAHACAVIHLDLTVIVKQVRNVFGNIEFKDWKPEITVSETAAGENKADGFALPVLDAFAKNFAQEIISYDSEESADEQIKNLSDEELCFLNIGAFDPKGGFASVIGSAATSVAGAAGETTHMVDGVPTVVMADGPAGLRISAQYYEDKKGVHPYGAAMPETLLEFMPGILKIFMGGMPKLPKGTQLKEQYCTAVPVGTALAQSWNEEFAGICGDIIGSEMERFGIHLWLAPALNIHRSPLCGRNFEYYSEDPLIAGRFATAVTTGVQLHRGRGVTIKHFAANNQETNRYFTNSVVSERAMREIYLKGFGICIREAHPAAVMTSYNLLNGIHTSESRALCTDILRSEFGFDGICMTDWVVNGLAPAKGSKYKVPDPAKVAAAGSDLFMPGSKGDYKRLVAGLKAGKVSRKQLQINAYRVVRLAKALVK
ncbi:MAG: fibronectin type III-like domain-contianing protein, partial [Lachnospiraceae bacterium]|nr:fibronectin type III-like domain-contianing protein [Lachnospiraceae bacterium]